jgi:hypothetical protein
MRHVSVVILPPHHHAFEHDEQDEKRYPDADQHLNWIEERGHDEGDEEEPIHQQ